MKPSYVAPRPLSSRLCLKFKVLHIAAQISFNYLKLVLHSSLLLFIEGFFLYPMQGSMTNSKHKKASSRWLILFMILCSFFLAGFGSAASSIRIAKYIPIQSSGRIKPLDAFSRNAIKLITGKETWVKKPAYLVVLDLLAERDKIAGTKFIRIDYFELKEKLVLPRDQNYFSVEELAPYFDRIKSWVKSSQDKRDQDLRPTKLEQKAEELSSKINMVAVLSSGESLTVVPAPFSPVWGSPYEAQIGFSSDFLKLIEFYKNRDGQSFEKAS